MKQEAHELQLWEDVTGYGFCLRLFGTSGICVSEITSPNLLYTTSIQPIQKPALLGRLLL